MGAKFLPRILYCWWFPPTVLHIDGALKTLSLWRIGCISPTTYKKDRLPTSQQEGKNLVFLRLKKITIFPVRVMCVHWIRKTSDCLGACSPL